MTSDDILDAAAQVFRRKDVLGQTEIADKSNEITAIPELLRLLDITGCIVMIDAIGTQTKIAEIIVAGGGDYLLAVKEKQGHLFEDIHCLFEVDDAHGIDKAQHSHAQTVNKGRGQIEIRECWLWRANARTEKD